MEDVSQDLTLGQQDQGAETRGGVRGLLSSRRTAVGALAATSVLGGLVEALFLVSITRAAFAITDGDDEFGLVAGWEVSVTTAVLFSLALVVIRVALAIATTWQSARLSASVIADVRRELAQAFMQASWSSQHGERSGRLQELLTTFAQQGAALVTATTQAVTSGCSLAAMLVSAIVIDPAASLVVIAAVAVLGSVLRPLRAAVKREAQRTATAGMDFATSLSETTQLGMEMHVFNVQPRATERVVDLIDHTEATTQRLAFLRGLVPAVYTGMAYLALVGALAVVAAIDSASLTSVGAVMLIMLRSLSYGQGMQSSITSINATLPFLGSLDDELTRYRNAKVIDHGQPITSIGALRLDDVSFQYTADTPVLRNVSATIDPHEVVGVIGPSGSGKSTLVQLLLGLREPTSGLVLSDGRDIRMLTRSEWARKVTFVPQDAHLIAGTISDNIRFLRPNVGQDEIEQAARLANLHDDVKAFPDGYNRQVGERGSHLSGGQQQRLIIARALVEHPDVLILDEPTSSLDVRSEHLIRQTLDRLRDEMTIIIIAHRLSTLDSCDRLMVIYDGELKAFDTPDNLEKDNDFYREALRLSGLR
jgi:ABC-type multidrug transport system fused ATPase/permease subunit